jgi:uncharacterized protein (UPF0333 family)
MIPFSKVLYASGNYELIYRNGEKPDQIHFNMDGTIFTKIGNVRHTHKTNGQSNIHISSPFDLFLKLKQ